MDELGGECTILAAKTAKTLAQVGGSTHKSITFSFDRCYGSKITTADIYNEIPYSLVQVQYVQSGASGCEKGLSVQPKCQWNSKKYSTKSSTKSC